MRSIIKGVKYFVICTHIFIYPAHATRVLTWGDCVSAAFEANADLRSSKESLKAAESQILGSRFNFFPHLSALVNFAYGNQIIDTIGSTFSTSLRASQNIFNGLQDVAAIEQAKANRDFVRANLTSVGSNISFNLKSAFSNLEYAQKLVKLSGDITKRRRENYELVSLRFDSGHENKGSQLLAKAYLEQAKYDESHAKNSVFVASTGLANVLGINSPEPLRSQGTVPVSAPPREPDFEKISLELPDYQKALAQEAVARSQIKSAKSGFFPVINLTSGVGEYVEDINSFARWFVGFDITLPIFSGGKDYYTAKSARQSFNSAFYAKKSAQTSGVAKLEQAYYLYSEARQRLEADRAFVEALVVREEIAREKYNNGLLSFEDWDIIENDSINRQKALLQSESNLVLAEAGWEFASGTGVIS